MLRFQTSESVHWNLSNERKESGPGESSVYILIYLYNILSTPPYKIRELRTIKRRGLKTTERKENTSLSRKQRRTS